MILGYSVVVPGKHIVRGSLNQEDHRFGRGQNVQSAAVALVALAMSLIHRSCNWTKPIVDEIVTIGDETYARALETLGFSFDPWEQIMTIDIVPPDFTIGGLKINCELRETTQRGIVDIKDPKTSNIRQGIERFFEENTHGVLETESYTVAIWEDDLDKIIYVFDPYPRGPTGMPLMVTGTACLVGFKDPKMVSDHIISVLGDKSKREFLITPIEIVIGKAKRKPLIRTVRKTASTIERRRRESEARRKKEEHRVEKLGRFKYFQAPGEAVAVLRGTRNLAGKYFSVNSRGNQDIPVCVTAFVMERLLPLSKWTCKTIDQILDVGDQLYKDCFVVHNPPTMKIGLEFILRQVIIKDVKVHVAVCKPVLINQFKVENIINGLQIYFTQKQFCLLTTSDRWVAIFLRGGVFYLFDPHGRNLMGDSDENGTAVVVLHPTIESLAIQLYANLFSGVDDVFHVALLGIKSVDRMEPETCRCEVKA